jgi:transcriptional regulator with XRE-family HTH domain
MNHIRPSVLKKLLKDKGLSLDELAKRARLNKQTIWRLTAGKVAKARDRTIENIARVLNVDRRVLSGETRAPELSSDGEAAVSKFQLNVRVSTMARNGLNLVARRYGVEPSQIVELAPFLFCWAAETSLRHRRDRVSEVKRACENARNLEQEIRHFPVPNFTYSEEKIAAEHESIGRCDLFGAWFYEKADLLDPAFRHDFETETENPFAIFLRNLVAEIGDVAKFEHWSGDGSPDYRVCLEEAVELVGGDTNRADEILRGDVALNEMPKEIRSPEKAKERAAWVRNKAAEYRKKLADDLAELDRLFKAREAST